MEKLSNRKIAESLEDSMKALDSPEQNYLIKLSAGMEMFCICVAQYTCGY